MSQDAAPFVPPARYPTPPRNMWYEVPKEPPAPSGQVPKPVFPWEGHQPRPSRTFAGSAPEPTPAVGSPAEPHGEPQAAGQPQTPAEPSVTASASAGVRAEPSTPSIHAVKVQPPPSEPWTSFQLSNAWDEVPEIGRYVEGLQKHRRGKSQGSATDFASPLAVGSPRSGRKPRGLKLTDFPSETERPSLPVTPAPIARPSFWGQDETEPSGSGPQEALPAAEGVPAQSEWVCVHGRRWMPTDCICDLTDVTLPHKDPEAQLQKLARQQYEHLLRRLSEDQGELGDASSSRVIPKRSLPFGSENVRSPTYGTRVAASDVSRPRIVKSEASTTGTTVGQTTAPLTRASTVKGESQSSGTGSPAVGDDGGSPVFETPLPRIKDEGTGS